MNTIAPVPLRPFFLRALVPLALIGFTAPAAAQARVTFSVDEPSASDGELDCTAGRTVEAGALLHVDRPGRRPVHDAPHPVCVGILGGIGPGTLNLTLPVIADVDALSFGLDARLAPGTPAGSIWFSVGRSSHGVPLPGPFEPNVFTESLCGDHGASVFLDAGLPMLPINPTGALGRHVEAIDGDGLPSCTGYTQPGLGLLEPDLGVGVVLADDLDALDVDRTGARVYFSLDGGFADPCPSGAVGPGSAAALGYEPGAILVSNLGGGVPVVWLAPAGLGLDGGGAGTDDLDALALWDNGNGVYNPTETPLGWLSGGGDMVVFSVRAGSLVIGMPDSLWGVPIEPGDLLIPPVPGGLNGQPGILVPAEALGLATVRAGTGRLCNITLVGDELDGLDTTVTPQFDCNGNGREDALDIVFGTAQDVDLNGVPDGCQAGPRRKIRRAAGVDGTVGPIDLR